MLAWLTSRASVITRPLLFICTWRSSGVQLSEVIAEPSERAVACVESLGCLVQQVQATS